MTERTFRKEREKALNALWRIGRCYETGDGVAKDVAEAVKWYRMAAEQGLAGGSFELAKCYRFGIGVRRNRKTSLKWLVKATEQGYTKAMVLLGLYYLSEFEGEYNPRTAVKWFQKAAEAGDAWGMFHLGECCETGNGVKKDIDAAFLWFCKAVTTAPEDGRLYQSVQNHVFDPNLKEYREGLLSERSNKKKQ